MTPRKALWVTYTTVQKLRIIDVEIVYLYPTVNKAKIIFIASTET